MSIDERIEALTRRLKQLSDMVEALEMLEGRRQDRERIQALLQVAELREQQLKNRRLPGH
jgi:hypothetical protein